MCQTIADWIDAVRLGHNDRLPAERMMSAHFATNRITLRVAKLTLNNIPSPSVC
ncbi:GntR family transcriptional regulator [Sodalis-like symbiont of Bactericera trigonica]|nr:GntR family transcriptional regulator [Sodalis-like symbiont of Bactericera trigonica]